jgi:phage terminase small subunit
MISPYEPSKGKSQCHVQLQNNAGSAKSGVERNEAERCTREAREKQTFARVRSIVDQALSRPRDNFGVDEALIELEEASICALSVFPPQSGAAVTATMAKAKLLGLIIDRQEVGSPRDYEFEKARTREELIEMLHERLGPIAVERFKKFVSEMKEIPVIEDCSNGNDEG